MFLCIYKKKKKKKHRPLIVPMRRQRSLGEGAPIFRPVHPQPGLLTDKMATLLTISTANNELKCQIIIKINRAVL